MRINAMLAALFGVLASVFCKRSLAATALSLALIGANTAHAQGAAAIPSDAEAPQSKQSQIASIEQRLSELRTKQVLSTTGMVLGGVAIVASLVKGTKDDQDKADAEANRTGIVREAKLTFDKPLLLAGVATLLVSTYTSVSASNESGVLRNKKLQLTADPKAGTFVMQLSFNF